MYSIAIGIIVYVCMIVEAVRAARNEQAQLACGGREPDGDVYAIMRVAYPGAFLVMLIEGALRGLPSAPLIAAGAALFVAAKALKWWAIRSLGQAWTFRIIVIPGASLVSEGPYRYLRHPNYVAVIGELIAVALVTGARVAGPIATMCFGALIAWRVAVENRALDAILRR